jgi:N-acetylmuramoyl-L-alanine amidase
MKRSFVQSAALSLGFLATAATANASGDYGPAIWRQAYPGHWYTSGVGKRFYVIHDMEGYYLSSISYFQQSGTQASVHYCINGLTDYSGDAAPGEVTQMVLDAYYAWHASCWNTYSMGTEHEGFANNPAWYTEAMYQASAALTRSKADKYGIPKDRNHIVGHGEWQSAAWRSYASANFGINPSCNTHTDPGPNWDWNHFMALINNGVHPKGMVCDFTGDHKTDMVIYRPSGGLWFDRDGGWSIQWGQAGDIPIPGDYNNWFNNDGVADILVFRPSTREWISRDGWTAQWGQPGDIPVPGDYDADHVTDLCTYSPSTGYWYLRNGWTVQWGQPGDIPVPGDYDGDGGDNVCVFRPSTREWIPYLSAAIQWGQPGDVPVPADWNHTGKTELCTYSPSTGYWYLKGGWTIQWGQPGDIPVPGDYNGDGWIDICVWRPSTGMWYVYGQPGVQYGLSTDKVMQLPYAVRRIYYPNN